MPNDAKLLSDMELEAIRYKYRYQPCVDALLSHIAALQPPPAAAPKSLVDLLVSDDDEAEEVHRIWSDCVANLCEKIGVDPKSFDWSPRETTEETVGGIVGSIIDRLPPPAAEAEAMEMAKATAAEYFELLGSAADPSDSPLTPIIATRLSTLLARARQANAEAEEVAGEMADEILAACSRAVICKDGVAKLIAARLSPLLARARLAEAVVDKLPKTADGVPIVPGMALFYPLQGNRRGEIEEMKASDHLNLVSPTYEVRVAPYCWFSTREAAIASVAPPSAAANAKGGGES